MKKEDIQDILSKQITYFKYFDWQTASDEVLSDKAFNIDKYPKYKMSWCNVL